MTRARVGKHQRRICLRKKHQVPGRPDIPILTDFYSILAMTSLTRKMNKPVDDSKATGQTERPTRKVVVLVHGMGLLRRNDMLLTCVNAISSWMDQNKKPWKKDLPEHVRLVETKHFKDAENKEPISSSVVLKAADQEWKFVEAFWAGSFDPPTFNLMIGWTLNRLIAQLVVLIRRLVVDGLFPFLLLIGFTFLWFPIQLVLTIIGLSVFLAAAPIKAVYQVLTIYHWVLDMPDDFRRAIPLVAIIAAAAAVFGYAVISTDGNIGERIGWGVFWIFVVPFVGAFLYGLAKSIKESRNLTSNPNEEANANDAETVNSPRSGFNRFTDRTKTNTDRFLRRGISPMILAWLVFLRVQARLYRQVDELIIIDFISRISRLNNDRAYLGLSGGETEKGRARELFSTTILLFTLQVFHAINALATIPLYIVGIVLMIPAMFLVWLLSFAAGIPWVKDFVNFVKSRLDAFLENTSLFKERHA